MQKVKQYICEDNEAQLSHEAGDVAKGWIREKLICYNKDFLLYSKAIKNH